MKVSLLFVGVVLLMCCIYSEKVFSSPSGFIDSSFIITSAGSSKIIQTNDGISTLILNATSGNATVYLPPAGDNDNRKVKIKNNLTSGIVTIQADGTNTIEGNSTLVLNYKNSTVELQSNGEQWYNISSNPDSTYKTLSASIKYNSGVPAVIRQDGNWISSLSDQGSGDIGVNITSGMFSAAPNCVATTVDGMSHIKVVSSTLSATYVNFVNTNNSGQYADDDMNIICVGAK